MLTIVKESILDQDVDAIVNPANSWLRHGGGLAKAIADKATEEANMMQELKRRGSSTIFTMRDWKDDEDAKIAQWTADNESHPLIATGDAGWTSAGRLPFKGIIHAVGPVWGGGEFCEDILLFAAYRNALKVGQAQGCTSIAFPAISAGIFGAPLARVADAACEALTGIEGMDLRICLMTDKEVDVFRAELSTYPGYQRTT